MESSVAPPPHPQVAVDADHLRLLSIFHYVMAGLVAVFGCIPIIHVGMGVMIVSGKFPGPAASSGATPFPAEMGWFFIGMGGLFILIAQTMAVLNFLSGRWIGARKNLTFCMVVAGFGCLAVPLGTVLGVFTLIILQRPTIQALFEANKRPAVT